MARTALTALKQYTADFFSHYGTYKCSDFRKKHNQWLQPGYYVWIYIFDSCVRFAYSEPARLEIHFYESRTDNAIPDFAITYDNISYSQAVEVFEKVHFVFDDAAHEGNDADYVIRGLNLQLPRF